MAMDETSIVEMLGILTKDYMNLCATGRASAEKERGKDRWLAGLAHCMPRYLPVC